MWAGMQYGIKNNQDSGNCGCQENFERAFWWGVVFDDSPTPDTFRPIL